MLRMFNKVVVPAVILLAVLIAAVSVMVAPPSALAGGPARVRIIDANGKEIMTDPPPIIVEGRMLAPLFTLADTLQAELTWDGDLNTAMLTRGQDTIRFRADSDQASKNGQLLPLGVSARIVNGRIYVPLKVVAGAFGLQVSWDGATHTVQLR